MHRYLIEVPHSEDKLACARVIKTFLETGSHYLTKADWGCGDGIHKAWLVVEAEDRDEARWIVPPPYRDDARIIKLVCFSMEEVDEALARHS
jgi:hypothetical protein